MWFLLHGQADGQNRPRASGSLFRNDWVRLREHERVYSRATTEAVLGSMPHREKHKQLVVEYSQRLHTIQCAHV